MKGKPEFKPQSAALQSTAVPFTKGKQGQVKAAQFTNRQVSRAHLSKDTATAGEARQKSKVTH